MARPRRIDSDLVGKAQEIAAVAKDLHTLRGAQASSIACAVERHAGTNGSPVGRQQGNGAAPAKRVTAPMCATRHCSTRPRRAATRTDDARRGARIPGAVGATGQYWQHTGSLAVARSSVAKIGAYCEGVRGISAAGTAWLAQGGTRHAASQKRCTNTGRLEKNCPKTWLPSPNPKL